MFKRAMKPSIEKEFTHPQRAEGEQLFLGAQEDDRQTLASLVAGHTLTREGPETTINATVSIRGTLSFERFLKLDGCFEGQLLAHGRLHVGPSGSLKADLNLESAIIEGLVEGNIHVEDHLDIRATAVIKGDITAKTLTVEPGATLVGSILIEPH
jgi:cytoskeletal protein CcmA (bactofilin family)